METVFKDFDGKIINEGNILTFDWFQDENIISEMRRLFGQMKTWTDEKIIERIHKPTFVVKKDDKGILYGEGLELKTEFKKRLYLHNFRFKYTKILSESIVITNNKEQKHEKNRQTY